MGCEIKKDGDGRVTAIICGRGRRQYCSCGRPCTKLCDFPLTGPKAGKTCDKPLCDRCAVHAGPELDYCQPHARMIEKQKTKTCEACGCPIDELGCGCNPPGA